jgi:hypothetical protein
LVREYEKKENNCIKEKKCEERVAKEGDGKRVKMRE